MYTYTSDKTNITSVHFRKRKNGGMMQTKTNKHNFSAKENATNVTLSQRNVVSKT